MAAQGVLRRRGNRETVRNFEKVALHAEIAEQATCAEQRAACIVACDYHRISDDLYTISIRASNCRDQTILGPAELLPEEDRGALSGPVLADSQAKTGALFDLIHQ